MEPRIYYHSHSFLSRTTDESREWDKIATNMELVVKWQAGRHLS